MKKYKYLPIDHEASQTISGQAKTLSPYKGNASYAKITIISPIADMFAEQISDKNGRFSFSGMDYPDSTVYFLNAISNYNSLEETEVNVDEISYPKVDEASLYRLSGKGRHQYNDTFQESDGGIMLNDVMVTATKQSNSRDTFSSLANYSITADEIKYLDATCIHEVLRRIPSIYMKGDTAYIRGKVSIYGNVHAAIALDGTILDDSYNLDNIIMQDVARIDVFKGGNAVVWGTRGGGGVISITTKNGSDAYNKNKYHVSSFTPLGYQQPKTIYSYCDEHKDEFVYWNGDVRIVDGKAVVDIPVNFIQGQYIARVEGVTDSGLIVNGELKFTNSESSKIIP